MRGLRSTPKSRRPPHRTEPDYKRWGPVPLSPRSSFLCAVHAVWRRSPGLGGAILLPHLPQRSRLRSGRPRRRKPGVQLLLPSRKSGSGCGRSRHPQTWGWAGSSVGYHELIVNAHVLLGEFMPLVQIGKLVTDQIDNVLIHRDVLDRLRRLRGAPLHLWSAIRSRNGLDLVEVHFLLSEAYHLLCAPKDR